VKIPVHIELVTPKQNDPEFETALQTFAEKYDKVIAHGGVVSVTDNPMGNLHFQFTEMAGELGLKIVPAQALLHLNTFHTRAHLDEILNTAAALGIRNLLAVSGDGSERLPRLTPESIGATGNAVTSVELLRYVGREYPGRFNCGVAFNQYEPREHELEKMRRKLDAGATFIITQPALAPAGDLAALPPFPAPLIVGAWMSKKMHLLSECVGYPIPEGTPYDPIQNLRDLIALYPEAGVYLALLGFKTQLPVLKELIG